jgi:phospholipase/lecithinase/hemolysin
LKTGDLLSPDALFEIPIESTPLPAGSVTSAATAAEISSRVRALNAEITTVSKNAGAVLYDLNALFARLRTSGLSVGSYSLTANYLGGLYSLSGYYPGTTVHALIANEILTLLNQTYKTSFPLADLTSVAPKDPAVRFRPYAVPAVAQ